MTNDRATVEAARRGLESEHATEGSKLFHSYHKPSFVYYGKLAELVQTQPSAGSDGGVGDCQHL